MSTQRKSPGTQSNFYGILSTGSKVKFYLAVFCFFSVFGLLGALATTSARPVYLVLVWAVLSGSVAVGWAYAFTRDKRVFILVIPGSILIPIIIKSISHPPSMATGSSLITAPVSTAALTFASVVLIVLGYILFVSFINHEGAHSLRLQTEIILAKRIHTNLVPPVSIRTARWELCGLSVPSTEVGGDLLDCVANGGHLHICVADVSGHGVHAGLMMGMVKSAVRMRLLHSRDLAPMVTDLNATIMQVKTPEMFVTAAFMHLDDSGSTRIALAGHLPVLQYQHTSGHIIHHESQHPPLGVVSGLQFTAMSIEAAPGDLFCILTDGITEILNPADEQFGLERIETILLEHATDGLEEIESAILTAGIEFGDIGDDRTLLLIRRRVD